METLLNVKDLHVSFFVTQGEVKAVGGISYKVDRGEVLGIVGESGSGKSVSALSILNLIDKPGKVVSGEIIFGGKDLTQISKSEMQKIRGREIAFIFQDPATSLDTMFTIGSQLDETIKLFRPDMSRAMRKAYAMELLELVGINDVSKRLKQYPFELSIGQCQRVMIAIALVGNPKILIADEPTTALDVTIQAQIIDLLKEIQKKTEMAVILITHDLGVINYFADYLLVMYGGKIVEEGNMKNIIETSKHPYTIGLIKSIPKSKDKGKDLLFISGSPINLLNVPTGCVFSSRCEHCMEICVQQSPPFFEINGAHKSACWLLHSECDADSSWQII